MLEIKNVTKVYNTGAIQFQALKGVSLKVEKGEFVAIIGPSGSGKSTFMNILGCLDVPTAGEYYFEGIEVSNYTEDQLAGIRNKKIGFIFQQFNLLPKLNAFENVELPLIYRGMNVKERKERVLQVLEQVGLSDWAHHKPSEMSGGQQQRVAIARALAGDPPLILADEPTGNLDSKSGTEVLEILKELNKNGRTILLITHDMKVAGSAQRIISIQDGLIVE
ncbi:MAG: putative transport system ATP-binding protein [Clostridia bacterium]|jgi:putative ABC transport system ATP-binding protein|nr:putative transport system ATP-binding protein [Clostridiales bacterium]MDK2986097.1 putative transport system ATP-binding protein [Clostridia bacterium]